MLPHHSMKYCFQESYSLLEKVVIEVVGGRQKIGSFTIV